MYSLIDRKAPRRLSVRSQSGGCLAAGVLLLSFVSGCGPSLPTAGGTVTLDGEPLPDAKVVFEAPDRPMAVATTDHSGRYDVRTGSQRGIAAGRYKVAVSAYTTSDDGAEAPVPVLRTPAHYNSAQTSGLTAEIKDGRNEGIDFHLKSGKTPD